MGRAMRKVYSGLDLQPEHFKAFALHLGEALAAHNVSPKVINAVLDCVALCKDYIFHPRPVEHRALPVEHRDYLYSLPDIRCGHLAENPASKASYFDATYFDVKLTRLGTFHSLIMEVTRQGQGVGATQHYLCLEKVKPVGV